jgi:hypothetical protein
MSRAHFITPTAPSAASHTVRLGAGNTIGDRFDLKEEGKIVKFAGESRYDLAVAGDEIEGFITSVEMATADGYTIGGVDLSGENRAVLADGLQATPGTGVIAIGDYVLAGSITAKGTALTNWPKVVKATTQATVKASPYSWRVVSLGPAGTGAVGTVLVIRRQSN